MHFKANAGTILVTDVYAKLFV